MTSWIDVIGWTLLHFVWQGALIAVFAAAVLRLVRLSRPQLRYTVACGALATMLASPVATALVLSSAPRTALTDRVHVLRSPQGKAVGVAIVPPWSHRGAVTSSAVPAPTEVRLPFQLDTDMLFSTIVALWLTGVLILLTRLAAGCWRIRTLQLVARREPMSPWQTLAEDVAHRLRLRRSFRVVDSVRVATPTVVGWLRPIVLLPVAAMAGLSPRQVEAILAHELTHIRRHDFAINLLQTFAETVLFYHPAVWWMSSRIRAEREHCCDDVAVSVCGDATEYASALTELASWSLAHPPLAMAATRGPLLNRVRRLLHVPESKRRMSRTTLAAAVVVTAVVGVAGVGAILRAQPLVAGDDGRFGPPAINHVLGFDLFPGPVVLPTDDPIGVPTWTVAVGNGLTLRMMGFGARGVIREAFGLGQIPIVGAPRWMDNEPFDVTVPVELMSIDGITEPEQARAALRQFLEQQMGLTMHRETRKFPAYAMTLARSDGRLGASLKPSTSNCVEGGMRVGPDPDSLGPVLRERTEMRRFCGFDDNLFGLSGARVTMDQLAREFHRRRSPLSPGREIVDRTGLPGLYDLEIRFGLLPLAAIGNAHYRVGRVFELFGVRSLFTALPEQLGLKLVDTTVSREVLVIDQINRPQ